jgi:hypothetical protein
VTSMNHVARLTLAAVLAISVAVLTGGVVLADTASDYETFFGAEAKKVAASRTKIDDAAFAAKLIKSAKKLSDSPALQVLLYEKACQFGSAGPAGCDTALEAVGLLEKAVPDKKDQWQQRKFDIVKLRYDKSYGKAKKAAGESYMKMLETLADANVSKGKGDEAKKLYSRAIMVAKYINSDKAETILAKSRRANAVVAQQVKLKSLQARLKKDAGNTKVRKELILLYVVGLDNPTEAAKFITDDIDEVTRTYVPLAAKKLDGLNEAICMELGDWYYRTLSKNASAAGKPVVLKRAKGYYEQFAELHTKKDLQSLRVETALESIEKELKRLDTPARRVNSGKPVVDITKKAVVTASSVYSTAFVADRATDGNPSTEWASRGGKIGTWIEFTFKTPRLVSKVVVRDRRNGTDWTKEVKVSFDRGATNITEIKNYAEPAGTKMKRAVRTKKVRITLTKLSGHNPGLSEVQIFGK